MSAASLRLDVSSCFCYQVHPSRAARSSVHPLRTSSFPSLFSRNPVFLTDISISPLKGDTSLSRTSLHRNTVSCRIAPSSVSAMSVQAPAALPPANSSLPDGATEEDAAYMRRAVELARTAIGKTSPNPMVGCVIVKDGVVIGEGFHPKAGEPHAEVFALRQAGKEAAGATAYVSLEPCNHFGRTPPCSQALVKAKIKRCVVGTTDPNPLVAGKGLKTLRDARIEVVVGVEADLCRANVEAFVCQMMEKRAFTTLRYTSSMDGRYLGNLGADEDRPGSYYSRLLAEYDAIIVTEDALSSNPSLLSSEPDAKQPLRVVLSRTLGLPLSASVFDTTHARTLLVVDESALVNDVALASRTGQPSMETLLRQRGVEVVPVFDVDVAKVIDMCYQRNASSVLLDAQSPPSVNENSGLSTLATSAMEEGLVDKVVMVIAPIVVGNGQGFEPLSIGSDNGRRQLTRLRTYMSGANAVVEGYLKS
eukprot:TRINITY_DN430_c1_g4_i1.p1 TRINITY_DN430_c1_g4~~TRINITY_DN430_c1_g4_i1.p1  ORF type:complete len:477 (+),score=52.07 TRINITY_DN430_c1_g4_i1:271-1701(+)